jgi:hypothetical protein
MAELIYSAIMSLDGFTEDSGSRFDWAVRDEERHRFFNALVRAADTYSLALRRAGEPHR